ncbi:MAG: formylglycine-generating enzyme family protein [Aureispira sp.]
MSILNNRTDWNSASDLAREEVISRVITNELKGVFEYKETIEYSCGGVKNQVASFVHLPTKMLFHLLPGEVDYSIGLAAKHLFLLNSKYAVDLKENSTRTIQITPFLISQYLITEQAWNQFTGASLYRSFGPDFPIDAVERAEVEHWAQKSGLQVPSEMEWEYACKAGSDTIFYWGNKPNLDYAWTEENTNFGVGDAYTYRTFKGEEQKPANAFGLLGMIGNLGEWVADDAYDFGRAYTSPKPYKSGSDKADGILRGGWNQYGWNFNRSTSRIQCGAGDTGCSARAVFRL